MRLIYRYSSEEKNALETLVSFNETLTGVDVILPGIVDLEFREGAHAIGNIRYFRYFGYFGNMWYIRNNRNNRYISV